MGNPLKKTMVFLGLAEEDYDEVTGEITSTSLQQELEELQTPTKTNVTPLRRVKPARTVGAMNEIVTVHPTQYSDAQSVAENFRSGVPVIINLSRMNENDAKRMIDFASGLAMGLNGKIERVTGKVFLLSPEHISVSGEDAHETGESGQGSFFISGQ